MTAAAARGRATKAARRARRGPRRSSPDDPRRTESLRLLNDLYATVLGRFVRALRPAACWCGAPTYYQLWCQAHVPRCRSGAHFMGDCHCAGAVAGLPSTSEGSPAAGPGPGAPWLDLPPKMTTNAGDAEDGEIRPSGSTLADPASIWTTFDTLEEAPGDPRRENGSEENEP